MGAYRNGWLVISWDRASFVYRSLMGSRCLRLPPIGQAELHRGIWTNAIEFQANGNRRCTLFLLKDGPSGEVAVADLTGVN